MERDDDKAAKKKFNLIVGMLFDWLCFGSIMIIFPGMCRPTMP